MTLEQFDIKVQIIKTPKGPAPDEYKEKWKQVPSLPAKEYGFPKAERDFVSREIRPPRDAYAVPFEFSVTELGRVSPEGERWFRENENLLFPPGTPEEERVLIFGADEVKIL